VNVTTNSDIGMRLKQFILILDFSQITFAQSISISRTHLNDILNGRKGVGGLMLANIAKAYKQLNIRWLLTGEGDMFELATIFEQSPPELDSGQADKVEEGVKIQYLKKEGQLEAMQRRLEDHERRLRDLENPP